MALMARFQFVEKWRIGMALSQELQVQARPLLSRLLRLNDTQEGILNIVYRIAVDRGLLLIDTKDLQLMLDYVSKNASQYTSIMDVSPTDRRSSTYFRESGSR